MAKNPFLTIKELKSSCYLKAVAATNTAFFMCRSYVHFITLRTIILKKCPAKHLVCVNAARRSLDRMSTSQLSKSVVTQFV